MAKPSDPSASTSSKKKDESASKAPGKRREGDMPDSTRPIQLQRRRVFRACESCRRKKIKCDGCEPTCAQCVASGSQCNWLQTKDRAALSRHYVQELEARLVHMESLFTQIAPVLDKIGPLPNGATVTELASQKVTSIPGTNVPIHAQPHHAGSTASADSPRGSLNGDEVLLIKREEDDFNDSFGQLALDEHGHKRWIGGSSTISLIKSFRAVTASSPVLHRVSPMEDDPNAPGPSVNKLYFPASVFFGKVRALPGAEEVEYPERDLADKMIHAYFKRYHSLIPVLDKPTFLRQYNYVMDNTHDVHVARGEAPFLSLLFAVFACAAQLIDDTRLNTEHKDDGGMGMVYYERALILHHISHSRTQVTHVQCTVLMSCFLCSINCLPQAWILVGQALRTAQDLGLHRTPRRHPISPAEKETLTKIWWGVYTLDRMLALALGRPLGINDADCDVELPVDVDDDQLPEYFSGAQMPPGQTSMMSGFISLIKLYQIGGRMLQEVYSIEHCKDTLEPEKLVALQQSVEQLDTELNMWCEELSPAFKSQSVNDDQVKMGAVLCSHYYSVLTTLHRNFLPVKRSQQSSTPKSVAKAVSAARSCIRLAPSMKDIVPASHHLAFFIQHLFSSAVILLLYAMHQPDPRGAAAAMEEARVTIAAVQSWEGQWPGARKCKELLMELMMTAQDAVSSGGAPHPEAMDMDQPTASGSGTGVGTGIASLQDIERRKSVTISTPEGTKRPAVRAKGMKRNQSRDSSVARRAAAAPYNPADSRRARSTSRRRRDDTDSPEQRHSLASLYHNTFASGQAPGSAASSPSAVPSPNLAHSDAAKSPDSSYGGYGGLMPPASPISPTTPHPDFNFVNGNSPSNSWQAAAAPSPGNGMDLFPDLAYGGDGSSGLYLPSNNHSYGLFPGLDTSYLGYDGGGDMSGNLVPNTPVTSLFDGPGLPFKGFDYIRNYNHHEQQPGMGHGGSGGGSGGRSMGSDGTGAFDSSMDAMWKSYDPSAFEFDPGMPFNLAGGFGDLDGGGGAGSSTSGSRQQ